ncbi:hypothetical protein HK097_001348 [Rhizophlyctis rosea]|uniref:VPS9 domain-containing protein n=1 Tax=Rhizophlyctis rosea TaxID=64517 RepID=A0AAD5SCG5_9FUNG|nr:hypothetical protein HK097_001348 [Rhizophlyctis rosea]
MMEDVNEIQDETKKLMDTCMEILSRRDWTSVSSTLRRLRVASDELYQIMETFAMENIYDLLYYRISFNFRQEDLAIADAVNGCKNLDAAYMGIPDDLAKTLPTAIKEFRSISTLRTPFEKIKCLMRTIYILNATLVAKTTSSGLRVGKGLMITSDFLIPLLVLVVIRSDLLTLHSNIHFMTNFTFEHDVVSGEYGYSLSTMEAVASYIQMNHESLARISVRNQKFWQAVSDGELEVVKHLADAEDPVREDPEDTPLSPTTNVLGAQDWDGNGPVMLAAKAARLDVLKYLLAEKQLTANVTNYMDQTPLHIARSTDLCNLVLEHGCPLDAVDTQGNTALNLAVQSRNLEIATLLLDRGADPNIQNHLNKSALHYADLLLTTLLLSQDADVNIRDSEGLTPLIHHAHAGRTDIAILIVETGRADVNAADLGQRTCLHLSGFRGYKELVGALIKSGQADLEKTTMRGNTALHAASDAGQAEVVEMLLQAGANAVARNSQGKTPADLAKSPDVSDLLDNYSLFVRRDFKVNERVAAVIRAAVRDDGVSFTVKSGTFPEISTITTVYRTLDDFVFLREQLAVEHPEVFLPELRDLTSTLQSTKALKSPNGSRVMKRVIKRLNIFVRCLLTHPTLSTHELCWEFLVFPDVECITPSFKREVIVARTSSKLQSLLEDIYENYAPLVDNLDEFVDWFRRSEESLVHLERAFKQVGLGARTTAKMKRDMGNHLRNLRYHVARPTSTIFEKRMIVSDLLRRMSDGLMKQSLADTTETAEQFSEIANHLAAAITNLGAALERSEAQAKTAQTEDKVRALSEAYYQYQEAGKAVQQKASLVNWADGAVRAEIEWFEEYMHQETDRALTEYVTRQVSEEFEVLESIEKAVLLYEEGVGKEEDEDGDGGSLEIKEGAVMDPVYRLAETALQDGESPMSAQTMSFRLAESIS